MSRKTWKAVFSPNRVVSSRVMKIIIAGQAALALAFWASSPLPILPTPFETFRALGDLSDRLDFSRTMDRDGIGPALAR